MYSASGGALARSTTRSPMRSMHVVADVGGTENAAGPAPAGGGAEGPAAPAWAGETGGRPELLTPLVLQPISGGCPLLYGGSRRAFFCGSSSRRAPIHVGNAYSSLRL